MPRHQYPESPLFYRDLSRPFARIVSGSGVFLKDDDGKVYLDGSSGAMAASIGHGVAEIADAVAAQMKRVAYVSGAQFTNDAAEELAAELVEVLPAPLRYSYFLSSGSEANEAAVKLARHYFHDRGRPSKWKVVARVPSYHGNTLTALSLSGREHYRKIYGPLLTAFPRVTGPDTYRQASGDPALSGEALEAVIEREDPSTVAAFILEPIIGSSAGAMVPPQDHYARVEAICRRHDVLLIADEIQSGIGRTGRWFASEHFGFVPDVMTLGKGLNGGYAPLSAVVAKAEIVDVVAKKTGYFNHAQTYSHTPVISAAGTAVLRYLKKHRLIERAAELEGFFFLELSALSRFEVAGDIRGKGLLGGIELVQDRRTKAPFPRSARFAERLTEKARQHGLVVWPNVGHVNGTDGDLVIVAPPLTITKEEITELVARLSRALEALEGAS